MTLDWMPQPPTPDDSENTPPCPDCGCDLDSHVSHDLAINEPHEYLNTNGPPFRTCGECGECSRVAEGHEIGDPPHVCESIDCTPICRLRRDEPCVDLVQREDFEASTETGRFARRDW